MSEDPKKAAGFDFFRDTIDCWHQLPNKAFFFALLAAWIGLFYFFGNSILGYVHSPSLFSWMYESYYESYRDPESPNDDAHGFFIPFLVVGLFWWRRKELLSLKLNIWWVGVLILTSALLLHLIGFVLQQPRISVVALFLGIYGLMALAWGKEWTRTSVFPFFFFIFSVPLGGLTQFITFPLQQTVSWLTEKFSHYVLGIEVMRVGTQLFDPTGTYGFDVQAPCSGIRSLTAIFLLATIYAFLTFKSTWKRLLLMALALPFSILGNLARMLLIIVASEMGGQSWGNYVHEGGPLGIISLVPYVPAIAGLFLTGRLMEKMDQKKRA